LAWLHETQVPSHALSQHTPSTHQPEAQTLALEQAVPFLALQLPVLSHACPSAQLPGISVPATAWLQVPWWPATLQDWHAPEQTAIEQQTPSTQKPEAQVDAVAAVHPSPLPRFATLYSQVSLRSEPSFGPAPNSTITPRWLSKAMAAEVSEVGPADKLRRYQVGPLASSSQVLLVVVDPVVIVAFEGMTCRRRRLS
jgi:hypothetical protein